MDPAGARDRRRSGDRPRIIWKHEYFEPRDLSQLQDQHQHYGAGGNECSETAEKIARNLSPHESTRTSLTLANGCSDRARSMSAEHEVLERQNQRLKPQNECVHKRKRIDDVMFDGMKPTGVFRHDGVVIVGIGVGDAAAAGRHAIESALK